MKIKSQLKSTVLIVLVLFMQSLGHAQTGLTASSATQIKESILIYSDDEDALIHKSGSFEDGREIVIESLPDFTELSIPVVINQKVKGSRTIKKHPSLKLPEYFTFIIEDTLTGGQFDLKYSDSYSFSVNRAIPDRFVLHVIKTKTSLTAMR